MPRPSATVHHHCWSPTLHEWMTLYSSNLSHTLLHNTLSGTMVWWVRGENCNMVKKTILVFAVTEKVYYRAPFRWFCVDWWVWFVVQVDIYILVWDVHVRVGLPLLPVWEAEPRELCEHQCDLIYVDVTNLRGSVEIMTWFRRLRLLTHLQTTVNTHTHTTIESFTTLKRGHLSQSTGNIRSAGWHAYYVHSTRLASSKIPQ